MEILSLTIGDLVQIGLLALMALGMIIGGIRRNVSDSTDLSHLKEVYSKGVSEEKNRIQEIFTRRDKERARDRETVNELFSTHSKDHSELKRIFDKIDKKLFSEGPDSVITLRQHDLIQDKCLSQRAADVEHLQIELDHTRKDLDRLIKVIDTQHNELYELKLLFASLNSALEKIHGREKPTERKC